MIWFFINILSEPFINKLVVLSSVIAFCHFVKPGFGHIASGAFVKPGKTSLGERQLSGCGGRWKDPPPAQSLKRQWSHLDVQALQAKVPAKFSPIGVESPVPVRPVDPAAVTSLRLTGMFLFEGWDQMLVTML